MKVAIVGGTAGLGYGLALRLAAAGTTVAIGSRQADKAAGAAKRVSETVVGSPVVGSGDNEQVVAGSDLVVVTVPYPGLVATYELIKPHLRPGAVVLDCNVALASEVGGKATRLIGVWEGSTAQQAKAILGRDVAVAAGFHTVMAGLLQDLSRALDSDILVCGDPAAKEAVAELVAKIKGARFVDCGPLERARLLEALAALMIGINIRHKVDPGAGIRITGLPGF